MRRWLKSRQADGALFLVMMIVFAVVLLALLVWVMFAHPARAAQLSPRDTKPVCCERRSRRQAGHQAEPAGAAREPELPQADVAAELTAQVKEAKAEAKEAQDRAEELRQAEAARRGRGRLARLRAAWRGE